MKKIFTTILLLLTLLAAGCTNKEAAHKPTAPVPPKSTAYTVVDDEGITLQLKQPPQRIVSLTYGTDEIVTGLVDIKRIQAYSRWAGDSEISFITKDQAYTVGCKVHDSAEAILALEPDLVLASTATSSDLVSSLRNLGVPVYIARSPHNYPEMCAKIKGIAAAVDAREKGDEMVKEMDARLQKLEARLQQIPPSQRRVAVAFNFTSAMGRKGDLLDSMLTMANVINGAAVITGQNKIAGQAAPTISKEQVVRINPDIFMLPTWNYNNKQDVQGYAYAVMNDPAYSNVKAVRNKQIKFVSDKYRYVASQHIVDAIENIAKAVYPEIF